MESDHDSFPFISPTTLRGRWWLVLHLRGITKPLKSRRENLGTPGPLLPLDLPSPKMVGGVEVAHSVLGLVVDLKISAHRHVAWKTFHRRDSTGICCVFGGSANV